jgi:hypothetical protein
MERFVEVSDWFLECLIIAYFFHRHKLKREKLKGKIYHKWWLGKDFKVCNNDLFEVMKFTERDW